MAQGKKASPMLLTIIFGVFMAAGVGILVFAVWSIVKSTAAAKWPVAKGRILSAEMKESISTSSEGKQSTTYGVEVDYRYEVDGRPYSGNRIAFGYAHTSERETHQFILNKLHSADLVEVRYSPENHQVSTLSYGFNRSLKLTLAFGFVWLSLVGSIGLLYWLASKPDYVLLENLVVR